MEHQFPRRVSFQDCLDPRSPNTFQPAFYGIFFCAVFFFIMSGVLLLSCHDRNGHHISLTSKFDMGEPGDIDPPFPADDARANLTLFTPFLKGIVASMSIVLPCVCVFKIISNSKSGRMTQRQRVCLVVLVWIALFAILCIFLGTIV